ncbi:hypothetical protein RIR_jg32667.t1 [Rhizophagus irregularis DAOM 181602=DAOM 197198]|nr:hypothetical protein RIR_jg32667.t1 [Rhizophagus irregularis DAOM 181602=DAOM 197198]
MFSGIHGDVIISDNSALRWRSNGEIYYTKFLFEDSFDDMKIVLHQYYTGIMPKLVISNWFGLTSTLLLKKFIVKKRKLSFILKITCYIIKWESVARTIFFNICEERRGIWKV